MRESGIYSMLHEKGSGYAIALASMRTHSCRMEIHYHLNGIVGDVWQLPWISVLISPTTYFTPSASVARILINATRYY